MTYHVIQGDGRRIGPVTDIDLRQWLKEGRIGPETLVEDEQGTRKPLSEWAGFEGATSVEPIHAVDSPSVPMDAAVRPGRSAWLIPLVIGCSVVCVGFLVLSAVLFPAFAQARLKARQTATLIGIRHLGAGVLMYAADNDDRLPPTMNDVASVQPCLEMYLGSEIIRTENPEGGTFLGNAAIAAKPIKSLGVPSSVVMFYDSMPWQDGSRAVCRLDGRATMVKRFDPAKDLRAGRALSK